MVDWRSIPKIDAHIHLMPQEVLAANAGNGDRFVEFGAVEDYLALMERYHIEAAYIMPFNDPYMLSMVFKIDAVHRNLSNMCKAGAGKLFCFADVDLRNPVETTVDALEKAMRREEFLGVKIHASNTGYPIDGAYYDRVFAWAEQNQILLELHSYPRTHLPDDVCSPSRIRRVVEKHPQVRLSIAHLGGFQYAEWTGIDAYFNISAILTDLVDVYGLQKTNEILRRFGTERLVFATDYPDNRRRRPEEIYDQYFELLGSMDFTQEEAENICKFNAIRMLQGKH